ncbi:hypothetical protein L9F63_019079, partial [Diploptera punctata]
QSLRFARTAIATNIFTNMFVKNLYFAPEINMTYKMVSNLSTKLIKITRTSIGSVPTLEVSVVTMLVSDSEIGGFNPGRDKWISRTMGWRKQGEVRTCMSAGTKKESFCSFLRVLIYNFKYISINKTIFPMTFLDKTAPTRH